MCKGCYYASELIGCVFSEYKLRFGGDDGRVTMNSGAVIGWSKMRSTIMCDCAPPLASLFCSLLKHSSDVHFEETSLWSATSFRLLAFVVLRSIVIILAQAFRAHRKMH